MRINSVEVQSVCNITKRIEWAGKTIWKNGMKPKVDVNERVSTHPEVMRSLNDKLVNSKDVDYLVTVRTSQGRFTWMVSGFEC